MRVSYMIFAVLFSTSIPSHALGMDTSVSSSSSSSSSLANNSNDNEEDSSLNHSRPAARREIADQTQTQSNDGKSRPLAAKLLDARIGTRTNSNGVGAATTRHTSSQNQGKGERREGIHHTRELFNALPSLDSTEEVNIRPFVMVIGPTNTQLYQGTINHIRDVVQTFLLDKLRNSADPHLALTVDVMLAGESFSWKPAGGSAALPGPIRPAHTVIRFDGGVAETLFSLDYAKPLQPEMKTGILNIIDASSAELLSQLASIDGLNNLRIVESLQELPVTSSPTASPTKGPIASPTISPTKIPTTAPTKYPTSSPTSSPTKNPTSSPTRNPTKSPTMSPTKDPTKSPTNSLAVPDPSPTKSPTTSTPTTTTTSQATVAPVESSQESYNPLLKESGTGNPDNDDGGNGKFPAAITGILALVALIVAALLFVRKRRYGSYLKSTNAVPGGGKMDRDRESDITGSPDSNKEGDRKGIAGKDTQQAYDTSTIPARTRTVQPNKRSLRNMFPIVPSASKKPQDIFLADRSRRRDERRELAAISELESGYGNGNGDYNYADDFSADPFLEISGSSASNSASNSNSAGASAGSPFSKEEDESFGMSASTGSSIQKEVMSSGSDTISPSVAYDDPSSRRDYQGLLKPTNFSAKSFVSTLSSEGQQVQYIESNGSAYSSGRSTRTGNVSGNGEGFSSDGETDTSQSATSRRSRSRLSSMTRKVTGRPTFRSLSTTRTESSFKADKSWDPDDADSSDDEGPSLDCHFQYTKAQTKPLSPSEKKSFT
uniref:Uncharacterized protein n=1 Tax=Chaetoceros debilis TaxID=122233 RepID=A0A7S3VBL6_9STRA